MAGFVDRGDKYHARARRAFHDLAERKVRFVVTDYLGRRSGYADYGPGRSCHGGDVRGLAVEFAASAAGSNRCRFVERDLALIQTL